MSSYFQYLYVNSFHSAFIQLPTWVRAIVSNQLARDAREWCKIYSKYNSGTYNNQWFVDTVEPREDDRQKAIALCDLFPVYFLHLTKVLPGAANNACSHSFDNLHFRVVVDYNKFTPNKEVPDYGIMYVLEQMP